MRQLTVSFCASEKGVVGGTRSEACGSERARGVEDDDGERRNLPRTVGAGAPLCWTLGAGLSGSAGPCTDSRNVESTSGGRFMRSIKTGRSSIAEARASLHFAAVKAAHEDQYLAGEAAGRMQAKLSRRKASREGDPDSDQVNGVRGTPPRGS